MENIGPVMYRSISELKPYKNNARTHSKKQVKQIAASLEQFGFINPVLLDDEGCIVAGHGRVEAATGERIRDKIAASKKKGIWMGGPVPLGYDLKDRNLLVNEKEAGLVQKIFNLYLKLRSVVKLIEVLNHDGDRTKAGNEFRRGMLYTLLANPIYIGKLQHKGKVYDGNHRGIIDQAVWSKAQDMKLKIASSIDDICEMQASFKVGKSWHGAVVIRSPETGTPEDIFDLPPHELRDLIRGFIWRDEHFSGMTIREIAKRDRRSDAFVGGMIRKTFEVA